MVSKDDKDGQIALLKEALEKIKKLANDITNNIGDFYLNNCAKDIEHIANTAIIDTTF